MNVAAIGHSTIDIFMKLTDAHLEKEPNESIELCIAFPTKLYIPQRKMSLGGNAVNVGVALMKNGHYVKLISRVGQDTLGSILLSELKSEGFDVTYTTRDGESDSSIVLNYGSDRTILSYHDQTSYRFPKTIKAVDWVYLSSLGFEDYQTFHTHLLEWLKPQPDLPLVYNPGKLEVRRGVKTVVDVILRSRVVILNKEEAIGILSSHPEVSAQSDVPKLLNTFIGLGAKGVVITDGRNGAYYADEKNVSYYVPSLPVEVADATGAGDAFASGFMLALMAGKTPKDALLYGIAQSANVIQVVGATHGVQTLATLDTMLAEHPEVRVKEIYE